MRHGRQASDGRRFAGRAGPARAGHRGRCRGTRRGRRARASRRSWRSTARSRAPTTSCSTMTARSTPSSRRTSPSMIDWATRLIVSARDVGIGKVAAIGSGQLLDDGKQARRRRVVDRQRGTDRRRDAGQHGARPGHRHLLADDRPHAASRSGRRCRRRADPAVAATSGASAASAASAASIDYRVGVEVEQAAHAAHRRRQVAPVGEAERGCDVIGGGAQRHRGTWPCGRPSVRMYVSPSQCSTPATARAPRNSSSCRPANGTRAGRRTDTVPGSTAGSAVRRVAAQIAGRRGVHLAHRVVELADAAEPGGEGDVGHAKSAGLDQGPGGLGALRPRQRQRSGAELVGEQPIEVADAVAEPVREAGHAFTVDDAVGDQPHRPRRRGRRARPTRASRARRRGGIACTPGSRVAGRPLPIGRSRRCCASASPPGSSAGSRCRWCARRRRTSRRSGRRDSARPGSSGRGRAPANRTRPHHAPLDRLTISGNRTRRSSSAGQRDAIAGSD